MSAPFIDVIVVLFACFLLCRIMTIFADIPFFLTIWFQAKQRASVQWLLSKSYSHQVPEDVREPFYRDVEVSKEKQKKYPGDKLVVSFRDGNLSLDFWDVK